MNSRIFNEIISATIGTCIGLFILITTIVVREKYFETNPIETEINEIENAVKAREYVEKFDLDKAEKELERIITANRRLEMKLKAQLMEIENYKLDLKLREARETLKKQSKGLGLDDSGLPEFPGQFLGTWSYTSQKASEEVTK